MLDPCPSPLPAEELAESSPEFTGPKMLFQGDLAKGEVPPELGVAFLLAASEGGESSLRDSGSNPVAGVSRLFWKRSKRNIICSRRKVNLFRAASGIQLSLPFPVPPLSRNSSCGNSNSTVFRDLPVIAFSKLPLLGQLLPQA